MNILLDTHISLWMLADDPRLSKNAKILIEDMSNDLYVSVASLWEIAIKNNKYPDKMKTSAEEFSYYCEEAGIYFLPIEKEHIYSLKNLENVHNDPFDRLLLAQAMAEGFKLMTHDSKIAQYELDYVIEV